MTGDACTRMIKGTTNVNRDTPVVGIVGSLEDSIGDFDYVICKPITRGNVEAALVNLHLMT